MDFGAIIKAPMDDKDWIKKILLMGVFMLIPIVGMFNVLGYMKAVYENRKAGKTELPDAGLGYIGAGFWVMVAFLPIIGVIFVFAIVAGLAPMLLGKIHYNLARIAGLIVLLANVAIALGMAAAAPAIIYLHIAKGERWASIKVGDILALIKGDIGKYVTFWLLFLVAGVIGGAGQIACGIGIIFTMPLCYAIEGVAIAEFEKLQG